MPEKKKPSCLFICTVSPLNEAIRTGGANLTRANFTALSELADVEVLSSLSGNSSFFSKLVRLVQALWGSLAGNSVFFGQKLQKKLHSKHFDLVFIDHSQLGKLAKLVKRASPNSKLIGAFQNIESEYVSQSMKLPSFIQRILQAAAFQNEFTLVTYADYLLCLTKEDSASVQKIYGRPADVIIPITTRTPDLETSSPQQGQASPYLLFCGSFFEPNIQGLSWFVENVLDQVALPLVVIGYQMENLKDVLKHPKLQLIGTVVDVTPYYWWASAVINPVFKGAGMNSKSVEAIAYGKPLYTTPFAIRGFPEPLPAQVRVCDSAEKFIKNLADGSVTNEPSRALIAYHRAHFSLEQRKSQLAQLLKLT